MVKQSRSGIGFLMSVLAALVIAACATTRSPQNYAAVLTHPARPDDERALDGVRKPAEVMAFYGVKSGDKVADIFAARGYYTAILSQLVGKDGMVYAANSKPRPELHERVKQPALANVRILDGPLDKVALPQDGSLDFVFIHLDYHDLTPEARIAMNKRIFGALKRGGAYGVVDHSAKEGVGDSAAKTLHRIEKTLVVKEVSSVGFRLDKEGTMLRRDDDTRDFNVLKERGRSDRFVLRFEKP
jgi:predicted methyltransferase